MSLLYLFLVFLFIFLMSKSADYMIDAAVKIAKKFHVSELIIGLTIVSMGTSAPELVVSLIAAIKGSGDISLANIVGSNIFNLGVILGLVILLSPVVTHTSKTLIYRDGLLLILTTGLLNLFLLDNQLNRHDGIILLLLFIGWLYLLSRDKHIPEEEKIKQVEPARIKDFMIFLVALVSLVVCGDQMVKYAVLFARSVGMSEWAIGMTVVAIGTSAPEAITSIIAIRKKSFGVSIGNLIGSDIFNIVGILGISSFVHPIVPTGNVTSSIFLLWATMLLTVYFGRTGWKFTRLEGAILLTIALSRIVMDLFGL